MEKIYVHPVNKEGLIMVTLTDIPVSVMSVTNQGAVTNFWLKEEEADKLSFHLGTELQDIDYTKNGIPNAQTPILQD